MANPIFDPAAYGQVPQAPSIGASSGVANAVGTGAAVYNQLPGYHADLANIGKNITDETAGKLPQDVIDFMSQQGAERGVAIGSPGSANANAELLGALGLSSLNLTNLGQQNLSSILPSLPGAAIANNPNFYVTPEQQYQSQLQQSIFAAAPNPYAAAMAKLAAGQQGLGTGMASQRPGGGGSTSPTKTTVPGAQDFGPYGPANPPGMGGTGYLDQGNTAMLSDLAAKYDPTRYYDIPGQGGGGTIDGLRNLGGAGGVDPAGELGI